MKEYKKILCDRVGEITPITFNRPRGAHNAMDRECRTSLADAVRRVQRTASAGSWCSAAPGTRSEPRRIKEFDWTDDDPYGQARQYQANRQMIEDSPRSRSNGRRGVHRPAAWS